MRNRDDWIELELTKQKERLKYIDATLNSRDFCDFPPRRIYFEPTNACNLRCGHCAAHNGSMTREQGFMDVGLFKGILEDIKDWNRCTELVLHQHGESTLHKEIDEICRLASIEYDFFTKLNTNGVNLTPELSRKLIKANIDYIVFSIDAITPESYAQIKGRPHFERVLNNILNYLELWGEGEREYPNYFACDIFLVEEERNRNDIPIIREMFERLPVGHVEVYELFNYMGSVQEANSKHPERFEIPRDQWPVCNTPWDVLGVRWNGDVVACIYDFDSRYVVGNVKDNSIREIWNSERMRTFRKSMIAHQFDEVEKNGPLCSDCTIMWQEDYQVPNDFYAEIKRMEGYLSGAIDRVHSRHKRTDELLQKHSYLKENRQTWHDELMRRIQPMRDRYCAETGTEQLSASELED
ncbi:MAG: hypothetical protein COB46_01185 [Rhodospirillaceae bacterium]|nr:MAG: hypothetical protein COB46_01185 [Rhodospirillaceae bacterium]